MHAFCGTGDENIIPTCREAGNYYILYAGFSEPSLFAYVISNVPFSHGQVHLKNTFLTFIEV